MLEKLKELIDAPLESFLGNADQAYTEQKEQEAIGSCLCRKCGEEIKCLHDKDESHIESLCGVCAN